MTRLGGKRRIKSSQRADLPGPGDPRQLDKQAGIWTWTAEEGRKSGNLARHAPYQPLPSSKMAAHHAMYLLPLVVLDSSRLNSKVVFLPLHLASGTNEDGPTFGRD